MKPLRIAIAGLGTVGGGVARLLALRGDELSERAGRKLELVAVSARDRKKRRATDLSAIAWSDDPVALAKSDADVVIELIGGENGVAHALVRDALANGKHVVTANKALLASHGAALAALAEEHNAALKFEAAAAGGIPIVKALRESLIAHGITAVRGILNGTCNFILTQMEATGRPFADVLAEAQHLGYAEADPTLDVGGGDTAHKLALLSSLAFGIKPELADIPTQGIASIAPEDIRFAREFGYRIKLLGVAKMTPRGLDQRVQPCMVRLGTPLADVDSSFNAVVAHAGEAGPFFFQGRGAGEAPTASAVIADLVDIARGDVSPAFGRPAKALRSATPAPPDARVSPFYLRFGVLDVSGVLADIARHLSEAEVSIESMIQRGRAPGEPVAIVMITHECAQPSVERALKAIAASDKVLGTPSMIPMEAG
ncbi:MAG TPA: homoserine dehydrogenase [Rhizomicrobium sp.]|jgi:homoserine dehydrogenase|nr:homoserine dehydrogenase [Rhizomicrobium sp.]